MGPSRGGYLSDRGAVVVCGGTDISPGMCEGDLGRFAIL